MAIADWIREATERRRERWRREAYMQGYADADAGKPPNPPGGRKTKRGGRGMTKLASGLDFHFWRCGIGGRSGGRSSVAGLWRRCCR